ncbi:MAG: ATP-binding protein [Rhodocyclaceae bacterium]|nr:ATP-binding protein [Rhodocyclaceae bacterium]
MSAVIEQKVGLGSGAPAQSSLPPRVSLARKGVVTMVILVIYLVLVSLVVAYERRVLVGSVEALTEIHQQEERQVALNILVARAILTVNENYFSPNVDVSSKIMVLEIESVLNGLSKIEHKYEGIANDVAQLNKGMADLIARPNRTVIADIRGTFHRLVLDLDVVTSDIRGQKQRLLDDFRYSHNRLTVEWVVFTVLGLGYLGGLVMLFFRRLAIDIKKVQERATEIVRGYRGEPLPNSRFDELGDLVMAVNNMQDELRKHEAQIEIVRQQQFHKEKMAAVGSLAAAVAHEINNPLSAIVGIAQSMVGEHRDHGCGREGAACRPDLVMEQARRVMQITRQIGEFSVPQSQEPDLVDINGLVRSTCNFVAFDRRIRRVELKQNLDTTLPAVHAVADHVVQVLMNLLINAADALENCADRQPSITVTTYQSDDSVSIEVVDNGCGIPPENIGLVFDEYFTTKPPSRGSGLGLALCRSLICGSGGDIKIRSRVNEGTTVTVILSVKQVRLPSQQDNGKGASGNARADYRR